MSWGLIGSAVVGGVISSVTNKGSSKGAGTVNSELAGFDTSGISATPISKSQVGVTTSPLKTRLLQSKSDVFGKQAGELRDLLPTFEGGIGSLTEASLKGLDNARTRSIGNLRENLQRRRVLGSSFAQDALARADAEFGQKESEIRASSLLQEADIKQKILSRIHQSEISQAQVFIDNMNLEAEIGTQLASGVSSSLSANARFQAQAELDALADRNAFFAPAIEAVSSKAGDYIGGLFPDTAA